MNFKRFHESKNVMPAGELKTVEVNGITFSSDGKGKYSISGTATAYASARFNLLSAFTTPISVSNGGQGTLSFFNTQSDNNVTFNFYNGTTKVDDWKQTPSNRVSTAYNAIGNKYVDSITITVNSGATVNLSITPEFTNNGVLPSEFEPYGDTWFDSHYIKGTDTDTITTLPATIYPLAQTATLGMKGNTTQNGTPTPDSPIMPQGTGERTGNLCGEYLDNASINSSGVVENNNNRDLFLCPIVQGQSYSIYVTYTTSIVFGQFTSIPTMGASTYNNSRNVITSGNTYTFTAGITGYLAVWGLNDADSKHKCVTVVNGSTPPSSYIPYGYKIPISSAGQTSNIYLGEMQTTRKIRKLVLTGEEEWTLYSYPDVTRFAIIVGNTTTNGGLCTHYVWRVQSGGTTDHFYSNNSGNVFIFSTTISTTDDFKAYLAAQYTAGTPVTVWYVLAEPEIGIVNEPLMKIGDYADSISGISIPTTAGANTLDVQATLKPSEVTANFNGWHPVADVHERESGAWT